MFARFGIAAYHAQRFEYRLHILIDITERVLAGRPSAPPKKLTASTTTGK